jgi:membrane protein
MKRRAPMSPKAIWGLIKGAFSGWSEDKVPRLGAALAYYTVFSLAPLLIIIISIAGFFFGDEAARGEIVGQFRGLVGEEGGKAIQTMIENAGREKGSGVFATVISIVTLLFGASGVFGELQDSLNTIWGVKPKSGRGILGMLKDRFMSFTMVLGVAFLLLVSLVLSAAIAAIGTVFGGGDGEGLLHILNLVVSFGVITLLFAAMYKYLPDVKIEWRDVWVGAAVTSVLFTLGKFAIGLYLGKGSVASAYGAAGSLVILLVWVYYSAQILFFGAEFTKVYAKDYGSGLRPEADAEPVSPEARAEQGLQPVQSSQTRPTTVPATPGRSDAWALAGFAAIVGFVLGRTPLKGLAQSAPEALPAAAQVTRAITSVDRFLAERRREGRRDNNAERGHDYRMAPRRR